jgi:DNA-binding MurR/RpiR family transcriptional regulator
VGFSFSGQTFEVHRSLELAHARGAFTVVVTGVKNSPVARSADVVLLANARESPLRVGALASRIVQLAIVDFIFVRVAQLCESNVNTAVEASKDAVRTQKLNTRQDQ